MDTRAKTLIFHVSAGHGHARAAAAVAEAFRAAGEDARVQCLDAADFTPRFFGEGYKSSYLFLIRRAPWLWGLGYFLLDQRLVYALFYPLRWFMNRLFAVELERFIEKEDPKVLVSTHFLPTEVAGHLKRRGRLAARVVTVVTDYLPHSFWIDPDTDAYAVALPETRDALLRRGVPEGRIRVTGIPIAKQFTQAVPRAVTLQKLGLKPDIFTVLLTSGGAGVGALGRIAENLSDLGVPVQILVICGTNAGLKTRMDRVAARNPLLKAFGFVDNMHELMDAADLVIGKGGGLTLTECLAKSRPMIVFEPVPGQESRNADILVRYGAGVLARSVEEISKTVAQLIQNPARMAAMREGASRIARPQAAEDVRKLAEGL